MFYLSKINPQSYFPKPRPLLDLGNHLCHGQNGKIDLTSNGIFIGSFDEKILQNWIGNYQNFEDSYIFVHENLSKNVKAFEICKHLFIHLILKNNAVCCLIV